MGNNPSGPRLLGNGKHSSYRIKLDNAAKISLQKEESDYGRNQRWELSYEVERMTCTLCISSDDEKLCINVKDCTSYYRLARGIGSNSEHTFNIRVEKEKGTGLLCPNIQLNNKCFGSENTVKHGGSCRGEAETYCFAYGCGTRMGLLVVEKKRKNNEEQPYMMTVAHYYVNSCFRGGNFGGVDIGFSIVVKIGVPNGGLNFSVDGPEEHPSTALLYMIDEVVRTGMWKPSACPHCKAIQWQRRYLSESEDSDTPLPAPPRYGGSQNTSNKGQYNGDGNGSIIQATKINFNKWRK